MMENGKKNIRVIILIVLALFIGIVAFSLYPSLKDAYDKRNAVFITEEYLTISNDQLFAASVEIKWETSWGPIEAEIAFEYQDTSGNWIRAGATTISIAGECQFSTPDGEKAHVRILVRAVKAGHSKANGFAQFNIKAYN